ncbi:MAG: DUF2158 domain-containing protein [Bryobacteraceae bacterium]|jgi:uncharacterized protein YodC (DUF2158 family)
MADEFRVGNVVQLKSGGPKMTITYVGDQYGTPVVSCSWFDGTTEKTGRFPPGALKITPDAQRD